MTEPQHFLRHREIAYTIENRGAHQRNVRVVLDIVNNAAVAGSDAVYVDEAAERVHAVFRVPSTERKSC